MQPRGASMDHSTRTPEVCLYTVDLDRVGLSERAVTGVLDEAERRRAARFATPELRRRWQTARYALRRVLGQWLDDEPARVKFAFGARGKPRLAASTVRSPLHFNLSHADGMALIGVCRDGPLGVDIERVRGIDWWRGVAKRVFATDEQRGIEAANAAARMNTFFRCWTRKEAIVKATGDGFAMDTRQFRVSLDDPLRVWDATDTERDDWHLAHLEPAPTYVGAIAFNGPIRPLFKKYEALIDA